MKLLQRHSFSHSSRGFFDGPIFIVQRNFSLPAHDSRLHFYENVGANDEKKKWEEMKHFIQAILTQIFAAISISVGSMIVGFTSAYTSPAQVSMQRPESQLQHSWIGSLMPLSALCGGILGGTLIEKLGRKTTLLGTAIPFIIGRTIGGICVGIVSLATPVYLGETIQPHIRGTLGLLPTTIGNIGVLLCFLIGFYVDWTWLAFIGGCIPVPFFIFLCMIPETPRWYVSKGKLKEAFKSLKWLRPSKSNVIIELSEIEISNQEVAKQTSALKELTDSVNIKALTISLGLMFFQQLSGINAVIFYTVSIFKSAGTTIDENLSTIIVGLVNFGATFLATILIDKLGRKKLLYISDAFMIISLTVLGIFFYLKDVQKDPSVSSIGWIPLTCFIMFVIAFSLGMGPIPWLMIGEIFPTRIRGIAASVTTAFNWTCTFVVTKTFTDVTQNLGRHGAFWLFSVITLIGLFFVIFFVPETKGKSLEEIERELRNPKKGTSIQLKQFMQNNTEENKEMI